MKTIYKYIVALLAVTVASFSFCLTVQAQDDDSKVYFNKTVSQTATADSVYYITIDAFVTGRLTVTQSPAPADIILVLDRSGSMNYDLEGNEYIGYSIWGPQRPAQQDRRINILKEAVQGFVETVKTSSGKILAKDKDDYGGHRIALVWFSGEEQDDPDAVYSGITGLNQFINVENLTTQKASGSGNSYNAARVNYRPNNTTYNLLNVDADGGTITNIAMQRAATILSGQNYSDKPNRSRIVVFFTDGDPGLYGRNDGWENHTDNMSTADGCIAAANGIKASSATVYSVGLFQKADGAKDATTTYLSYTSSDYTDKTAMPTNSSSYVAVSNEKSIVVKSASALQNVFDNISQSAGGDYSASSSSSVLIDVVSTSFFIPPKTSANDVKVYKDTCNNSSAAQVLTTFANNPIDITSKVDLDINRTTGEVKLSGFDYGENWCGWNDKTNGPHGNRVILEIPIKIDPDAVGGPAVETNAPGSGLTIINAKGDTLSTHQFISPTLPIPVQIWIQKHGLQGSDSAVYTIRRTPYVGTYETDEEGNYIIGEDGKYKRIDYSKIPKDDWDTFTKVVVNIQNMDDDGIVKIVGLDPHYIYKIEEDAWAFGYTYQDGGIQYTIGEEVVNPFEFWNTPNNVKFDEATARNVFNEKKAN